MRHHTLTCALLTATTMMASAHVAPASPSSEAVPVATNGKESVPLHCDKLERYYFRSLPGVVANCYANQKWRQGNYQAAIESFKLAAGWASKDAQLSLGLIYYTGRQVATNKALGLGWLKLAAERDDQRKQLVARSAAKHASPQQRRHARQLLPHMRDRYGDDVAAERAWTHYAHSRRYQEMARMVLPGLEYQSLPNPSPGAAANIAGMIMANVYAQMRCQTEQMNRRKMQTFEKTLVDRYFDGWHGVVEVGPLKATSAPTPED